MYIFSNFLLYFFNYQFKILLLAFSNSSAFKTPDLYNSIKEYEKKYPDKNNVPRPSHWSGWCLNPDSIEFWLDGKSRIHERLKYIKNNNIWEKVLLSP